MIRVLSCVLGLCVVSVGSRASAQLGLRLHEVGEGDVRVDGMLRDWRGQNRVRVGRGNDASLQFVLGYDADGLYVMAAVKDERVIRSTGRSNEQDAIVITFAMPQRRGYLGSEVWIHPGIEGRASGAARVGPIGGRTREIPDARVVEARARGGYNLEAFIPWGRIPGGARWERGSRAALRMHDVDSEARPRAENSPATIEVNPRRLERLAELNPTGGEHAVLERFLQVQNLRGARPRHDMRGNVCGDGQPERIVHVEKWVLVMGPGYRDGTGYDFVELPVASASDVISARLRDFTGDGQRELFMRLRQRDERGTRDLWQLFTFNCRSVEPLFGLEVRKSTSDGHVESRVRVRGRRGAPTIQVTAGEASGLTPDNFREARAGDARGILLPWGPVLSRTYRWDGRRFAVTAERANPTPHVERPRQRRQARQAPRETTPPPPPSVRQLLAAVRRERRVPRRVRGRFAANVNLAGDAREERLVVFGKALVVVGPGFRNGTGYFHYEVQVAEAVDVISVTTVDLNRDGRAEVLVRARQRVDDITRELLMVHRFARGGTFPRVLTIEVAREMEGNRVENEVRTRGGVLEVRPGRARGWDASNWPWAPGGADAAIEPLLLPWRDSPRRHSL